MSFGITDQQREDLEKEECIHNHSMTSEDAKYIVIGTEDGWLECKGSKGWEEYLEAKKIVENNIELKE